MFEFEKLPNEMQLEILKRTEFRTIQRMKSVSKNVENFIKSHMKYMKPMPIRQMFVTSEKISLTLSNSNNICAISPDEAKYFLIFFHLSIDFLWVELNNSPIDSIQFLESIIPKSTIIHYLKLGSCFSELKSENLSKFLKTRKCTNLIIDWRFHISSDFFNSFPLENLNSLTIGERGSKFHYDPINGHQLRHFRGSWLELGPNNLNSSDIIRIILNWKENVIKSIDLYNISLNFSMIDLIPKLSNISCQKTSKMWQTFRASGQILEIFIFYSTNFSMSPSIILKST